MFYIKIRQKCTVALMWFHSFFSRKKSEIWIAFTFFEKWKVKSFSFSLFSRNEKWIDFWFHSFREVKVKLKSLEIEIERWNMKKILENSRETRLSQVTALRQAVCSTWIPPWFRIQASGHLWPLGQPWIGNKLANHMLAKVKIHHYRIKNKNWKYFFIKIL